MVALNVKTVQTHPPTEVVTQYHRYLPLVFQQSKIAAAVETQMLLEHNSVRRHVTTSLVVFVLMKMNIKIAIHKC